MRRKGGGGGTTTSSPVHYLHGTRIFQLYQIICLKERAPIKSSILITLDKEDIDFATLYKQYSRQNTYGPK